MDDVEWIAAGSASFGFGVGYLLAYWLVKRDLIAEVTMRIAALRKIAEVMAMEFDGYVKWDAVDRVLTKFPGQHNYDRRFDG